MKILRMIITAIALASMTSGAYADPMSELAHAGWKLKENFKKLQKAANEVPGVIHASFIMADIKEGCRILNIAPQRGQHRALLDILDNNPERLNLQAGICCDLAPHDFDLRWGVAGADVLDAIVGGEIPRGAKYAALLRALDMAKDKINDKVWDGKKYQHDAVVNWNKRVELCKPVIKAGKASRKGD